MKYKPEQYNRIHRYKYPKWAGWKVIDEQKAKENFPKNLVDRKELLDDLEYSLFNEV